MPIALFECANLQENQEFRTNEVRNYNDNRNYETKSNKFNY